MKLISLLTELNRDELYDKHVVKDKTVSQDEFAEIEAATGNKLALVNWMLGKIKQRLIRSEDIYKYEQYFKTFNRRKRDFPIKDVGQIKTQEQLRDFVNTAIEIARTEEKDPSKAKGVSKSDKYTKFKIGQVDGFDVYKIPKGSTGDEFYNMSCELGSGTEWCTATGNTKQYFNQYIQDDDLYIFIKPGTDEKYQFHFASGDFMDKNDSPINFIV